MPVLAYGTTTFHVASQCVAPSANAASRCSTGTASSTSRETERMNGTAMMASTRPAARNPTPYIGPWNSGRKPSVDFKNGSTTFLSTGTRTKMPSKPKITLGTAASSSMTNVRASEMRGGASSARKIAAPTPSGTAISRATAEVTTVP